MVDFAPDRTLKVMAEAAQVSARAKKSGNAGERAAGERELLGEFLNFCPIIAYNGTVMRHFDVNSMMEHLKRVYVDRVVNHGFEDNHLYNDKLLQLDGLELQEFNKLKGVLVMSKANPRSNEVDVNNEGFKDEDIKKEQKIKNKPKKQRTPEEEAYLAELREKRKNRLNAISILRCISIRMPLMIYGAELKDDEEITIDNFVDKVDDASWEEFMPRGVTKEIFAKFAKYYDPDIFRAAGRQIRDLARAADRMTVTERVQRISHIFSSFRNPDKETVLTPWRVVNMHLSDTIGGYCFYDDEFNDTLPEPRFVDRGEVTRNVFGPTDTHVLEINSKSGLYPLYVAYSIFRYRLDNKRGVVDDEQALWDQILRENLFVVCKTPMAKSITLRTLRGFRTTRVNARYFDDLINQIRNKPDKFIKQMSQGRNYWNANSNNNMKFNAIVGNPPYQEVKATDSKKANSAFATAIYPFFIDIAFRLESKYVSLITPSRWLTKTGQGVSEAWVDKMLDCNNFIEIFDYFDASSVFKGIEIKGGINYFLLSRQFVGKCIYHLHFNHLEETYTDFLNYKESGIVIRDGKAPSIIEKIIKIEGNYFSSSLNFSSIVGPQHYFDKDGLLTTSWRDYSMKKSSTHTIKYYLNKNLSKDGFAWIKPSDIPKGKESIPLHKVYLSKAYGAGDSFPHQIIGVPFYGEPNSVCSQTYLCLGYSHKEHNFSKKQCLSILSYMRTRFFRYLVYLKKKTQDNPSSVFQFVPMQDFSEEWTDEKLYAKYGLTDEEIAYIESMIKPM